MNFGKIPKLPDLPTPPVDLAKPPTHIGTDVGHGPLAGNVGVGVPQNFDPNHPSVAVDATIHNPTGIGGDIHLKKDIPIPTQMPDIGMPKFGSGGSGGGGFGLPKMPAFGMPSMPSLPSMPDISLPDMPSFGMPDLPSFGMPDLPSFGMPDISLPGMPGFRFPDLPKFDLPEIDLGEWDLSMPDLIPDWGGDSEDEKAEPHKRAKHQDKLKVKIHLETRHGKEIPDMPFVVTAEDGTKVTGRLDRKGKAEVKIPRGEYRVDYPDRDVLKAKILAREIQYFVEKGSYEEIPGILDKSAPVKDLVESEYNNHCTGLFGGTMYDDLKGLFKKHGALEEFKALWAHLDERHREYTPVPGGGSDTLDDLGGKW